jgi:hypothetical protein
MHTKKKALQEQNKLALIEPLPLPDDDAGGVPAINGVVKPLSYLRGESGWGAFFFPPSQKADQKLVLVREGVGSFVYDSRTD